MIQKLEITGRHMTVDEDLEKYVIKKIGKLDKYIQRHARESAHAEVKLIESKSKDKKQFTCEVILNLPGNQLMAKETTLNMFAAIDIAEAKLKTQLKKYKARHTDPRAGYKGSQVRRALNKILSR